SSGCFDRLILSEQFRVTGLERPGDERGESACLVLKVSYCVKVFDYIFRPLDAAEHHCCRSPHAYSMGLFHDFQPLGGFNLFRAQYFPYPVRKHLCSTAGYRIETGQLQGHQSFSDSEAVFFSKISYLRRRKTMDIYRISIFDRLKKFYIVFYVQIRMKAAL